ncbi:MAG: FAD-binding oxidoreductase [Myxococcota bacterium]
MADIVGRLRQALGDRVRTDPSTLDAHRRDRWPLSELLEFQGRAPPRPLAVVEATSTDEVAETLRQCREARVAVIPFGGGSGVCGGILADPGAIVLSTRGLEGLVELDDRSLAARFRAGTMGMDAERAVEAHGLTIGHWPQSIDLSTVGGWVATRAAGQLSTAYGSIEDLLLGLEVVLPDGHVLRTRRAPRSATGPDLRQLFCGSEGTLGVITEVELSLRERPTARRGQAFDFADFDAGLEAIRRLVRAGWRPPVVRLYDTAEGPRQFPECAPGRALLLLLHEGPEEAVEAEAPAVARICVAAHGRETDARCVDHWLERRNHVPEFRDLFARGLVFDTIEMSATWDRIGPLYENVRRALLEVPDVVVASAHSSHSYRSGTNLYFTFVARPADPADLAERYRACWRGAMRATLASGGSISHHHGIGRVRREDLPLELGEAGLGVLRALKRALDPEGLLNPGVLL